MTNLILPEPHGFETNSANKESIPSEVRWALRLLWLSLGLSAGLYCWSLPSALSAMPAVEIARAAGIMGLTAPFLFFIFDAFLNLKISRKKNWARIVKLMFTVSGIYIQAMYVPKAMGIEYITGLIAPVLDVTAMYLLFVTSGRLWFCKIPLNGTNHST